MYENLRLSNTNKLFFSNHKTYNTDNIFNSIVNCINSIDTYFDISSKLYFDIHDDIGNTYFNYSSNTEFRFPNYIDNFNVSISGYIYSVSDYIHSYGNNIKIKKITNHIFNSSKSNSLEQIFLDDINNIYNKIDSIDKNINFSNIGNILLETITLLTNASRFSLKPENHLPS